MLTALPHSIHCIIEGFLLDYAPEGFSVSHRTLMTKEPVFNFRELGFVSLAFYLVLFLLEQSFITRLAHGRWLRSAPQGPSPLSHQCFKSSPTAAHKPRCEVQPISLSSCGNASQVSVHRHSIPHLQIKNCSEGIHNGAVLFCLLYQLLK